MNLVSQSHKRKNNSLIGFWSSHFWETPIQPDALSAQIWSDCVTHAVYSTLDFVQIADVVIASGGYEDLKTQTRSSIKESYKTQATVQNKRKHLQTNLNNFEYRWQRSHRSHLHL